MLTFNVVLAYQGLLFWDFLWFFFSFFFFQSDRPTQYQETLNEKKRGMAKPHPGIELWSGID